VYQILYYTRHAFFIDIVLVNSMRSKNTKSISDTKKDKIESEAYEKFLATELPTEDEV
jgi:hypothetical protein